MSIVQPLPDQDMFSPSELLVNKWQRLYIRINNAYMQISKFKYVKDEYSVKKFRVLKVLKQALQEIEDNLLRHIRGQEIESYYGEDINAKFDLGFLVPYKIVSHELERDQLLPSGRYYDLLKFINKLGKNRADIRAAFGINNYKSYEKDIVREKELKTLEDGYLVSRKSHAAWRMRQEAFRANCENRFLIFGTMTVNGESYNKVFCKRSVAHKNFIRTLKRRIGKTLGLSIKQSDKDDTLLSYFTAIEKGGKGGRPHYHCLLSMKALPWGSRDPNQSGIVDCLTLDSIRDIWKYGISEFKMVRFGFDDAYARQGYTYPMEFINGRLQPIKCNNYGSVASYITKYFTKQEGVKICHQTVKSNRGFGLKLLQMRLKKVPVKKLRAILKLRVMHRIGERPPMKILRRLILRRLNEKRSLNLLFLRALLYRNKFSVHETQWRESLKTSFGLTKSRDLRKVISDSYAQKVCYQVFNILGMDAPFAVNNPVGIGQLPSV